MSGLITSPKQIWLSTTPVDLRKGIDGLTSLIKQTLGSNPCTGDAYVFCNSIGNRLKVVLWDGNGVWLCQRRLHRGHFIWSRSEQNRISITQAQWEWLVCGVDWQRLSAVLPEKLYV